MVHETSFWLLSFHASVICEGTAAAAVSTFGSPSVLIADVLDAAESPLPFTANSR